MRVGMWMRVRDSAAPVLAGQSSTVQSATGHHVALRVATLCKTTTPRHASPVCHVPWTRGPGQASLTTLPPGMLPAHRARIGSAWPGALLVLLKPLTVLRPLAGTPGWRGWSPALAHALVRAVAPPGIPGVPAMALWSPVTMAVVRVVLPVPLSHHGARTFPSVSHVLLVLAPVSVVEVMEAVVVGPREAGPVPVFQG